MTLNEWEQSNIEVLTSREMGEWLGRRENRLLDKIRAEIGQLPSYVAKFNGGAFAIHIDKEKVLQIIDKYKTESEDKDADSN